MSEVKVNKISPRTACGTVTLGDSGDTFTVPSGVTITNNGTQTGFGRTGTVDWETSIQTGTVTAATGSGYFVDTTSGEITVNLPAAAVGSIVAVSDYASTAASNNIIISPNGSEKINGVNDTYKISTAGLAVTLVYADATRGWKSVTGSDADATGIVPAYVAACGGTPCSGAICGNYKTHTFTGPGTFTVSCAGNPAGSATVDYLVVGGGGGGGNAMGGHGAGAGGAGGFRVANATSMPAPQTSPLVAPAALSVVAQGYPVTIDGGGAGIGGPDTTNGNAGGSTTFSTIISAGGGYGAGDDPAPASNSDGGPGGSGGGAWAPSGSAAGGLGNTPSTTPPQGFVGGAVPAPGYGGAGGGGAGAAGGVGLGCPTGGVGGVGSYMVQTGFAGCNGTTGPVPGARYFAGGGGGGSGTGGAGGEGGGGKGGDGGTDPGTAATVNTGGGGGGTRGGTSGAGGSGIVIIRYKFQ
jgi:hypothetical protein